MSLKAKISMSLLLALAAIGAGLAPAVIALFQVAERFQVTFGSGNPASETEIITMQQQLNFSFWAMAPGSVSVLVVLTALALLARRTVVAPLTELTEALASADRVDLAELRVSDRADEIGTLSRAIAALMQAIDREDDGPSDEQSIADVNEKRFRDFASASVDWLWETDTEGHVTYFSGRIREINGYAPQDIIGQPLDALVSVRVEGETRRPLDLESRRAIRDLICTYSSAEGERFCRLSGRAFVDEDDIFQGFRGAASDITDAILAEEETRLNAFQDGLTGLANRRLLEERLEQALAAQAATQADVAVLYLDIDRFKTLNDAYGHAVGDAILKEVSTRLTTLAGPQDTVSRIGGDEFAIVQADKAQPEAAEHLCLALLKALRDPFEVNGFELNITGSVGCAIASTDEAAAIGVLRNADVAMYRAKDDGRDAYRFHEAAVTNALRAKLRMETRLRTAIQSDEIEVYYQPIMGAASRGLTGFEAMVRWPKADDELAYPGDFLALAEDTGLIVPLSEKTLDTACRTAMSWPDLTIAVNLSPVHFLHESLLKTVVRVLRESCLSSHLLELEITEAALLTAEDTAIFQFDAIREMGVRLVMDKFGSGKSSLQHLKRFKFDKLKLDRTFISGIEHDPGAAEITRSVLSLATALDMHTAAEGVVSEKQAALLIAQGCAQLQGKLFGKAMSAERAFKLLRTQGIMPGAPKAETHL